jgi:EAL domain-containing protein (putative c-di-GMP-specific phosphodiesterase class I)
LIAGFLRHYSAQAHWLTLEITESALLREPEQALQVLRTLKDMGLRLSIDDFGTGYSSMAYLKRLPVDELKIDKSFVLGLSDSVEDEIIVRSTIDLGHNFGLKITAEGVEDEAALGILKRLGCDKTQGYLFNRPQPAHILSAWVADVNREGVNDLLRRQRVKLIVNMS